MLKKLLLSAAILAACLPAGAQVLPSAYVPLSPCRLYDSRVDAPEAKLAAGTDYYLPVRGSCGVPANANAVALLVTTTEATGHGWFRVWESSLPVPAAGNVHFDVATATAMTWVRLCYPAGECADDIAVRVSTVPAHVILDVVGYTAPLE